MQQIPLRNKDRIIVAHALVDDDDFEIYGYHKWHMTKKGYVVRGIPHPAGGVWGSGYSRYTKIGIHRLIMGLEWGDPREPDHIDHNRLNNQRYNLRLGTRAQNAQNLLSKGGSSSYRGVTWKANKWQAQVVLDGKHHLLGRFESEDEAGQVAASWRREHMPFSVEGV
jgi:hypothetical protein